MSIVCQYLLLDPALGPFKSASPSMQKLYLRLGATCRAGTGPDNPLPIFPICPPCEIRSTHSLTHTTTKWVTRKGAAPIATRKLSEILALLSFVYSKNLILLFPSSQLLLLESCLLLHLLMGCKCWRRDSSAITGCRYDAVILSRQELPS